MQLIKSQMKLVSGVAVLLAAGLLMVVSVFCGVQYLDAHSTAAFLERFAALTGIVLLVPLFRPEQDTGILEVVSARPMPHTVIILIRLALALACLAGLTAIMTEIMRVFACNFPYWQITAGTFITALMLGAAGFLGAGLTNNTVIGYSISFMIWFVNLTLKNKLGLLYLFSMSNGDFRPKYVLLPAALLLIAATLCIRYIKKRLH